MKISVVGLGKAGLPLAAVIADSGLDVLGVDVDKKRVMDIENGLNPIPEETGLDKLIKKHIRKNLNVTSDPLTAAKSCNAHIVIVPLFIDDNKKPDFSVLKKAFTCIGQGLKKGDIVVLETTVPTGTTKGLNKDILEKESGFVAGIDFFLAHSPERIMTGHSISRFKEFPKIVGGINKRSGEKAAEIYRHFSNIQIVKNSTTAEMIKIAEGIYRDVNIGLANELLKVCDSIGVDFSEMRKYANHKYCNIHQAGIGVGGHCIPVYPWFIINQMDVPIIKTARIENDKMIYYWKDKISALHPKGAKIGVVGLSYRSDVKELAYTRSIPFIELLEQEGFDVYVADELFSKNEIINLGFKALEKYDQMDLIVQLHDSVKFPENKTLVIQR
ncbi:MAG: nucleotide sugar dehydrogenase [Candidatus Nanohalarchaeota archaeon]|nr:MAG: nucleotide sugar dehydrogenase [Candidatus Nanohaloarchaeota archaeon]